MRVQPEILAPAGAQEQLLAAVRCGADAVYLGLSSFNARRNAENFDADALARAVSHCHARDVRVYVALNTLVLDVEREALVTAVRDIAAAGADAVIVQDLGVAALVRRACPALRLHGSTQMAVHNLDGARALERLGFVRVVLARELTVREIAEIAAGTPLEVEVFVHGALCMSMSGCCTLSSVLGGRSGNRGLCAQPCRLNFRAGERPYALSLKDLSGLGHLGELREAGVRSFKIEGRMKRPEYVAAAVTACVAARAGEQPDLSALRAVFSRSGFTDGYLTGARTLDMFGTRTREDVAAAAGVLKTLAQTYRAERPRVPVDLRLDFDALRLTATDGVHTASAAAPAEAAPQPADGETARERALRSLQKTGGTPFLLNELTLSGRPATLPASALNAMRRDALDALLAERARVVPLPFCAPEAAPAARHAANGAPALRLRFARASQVCCEDLAERVLLPVSELTPALVGRLGGKAVAELPRALFPRDEVALAARLGALREAGLAAVQVENLYGFPLAARLGLRVHGGFGLNALNTAALDACGDMGAADVTLSFELPAREVRRLGGGLPRGLVAYGYLPLMYFRACPLQGPRGCGACPGEGALADRRGVRFPVRCEGRRYSVLYNSVPLYLGDDRLEGLDFATLYFTQEPREACERVVRAFCRHEPLDEPRTRGLYRRDLL